MHHPICGYENFHVHSDFSLLDGFGTVEEYSVRLREINQQFLCISDHGVMGAVPQQIYWSTPSPTSPATTNLPRNWPSLTRGKPT